MFRDLKPDEIEIRVASINEKGASFLLYKNARCDMNILDETVGNMHWQRHHLKDNANCIVSIYCTEKKEWVQKEDTGAESDSLKAKGLASDSLKAKGLASDSFKRACFNWGIGRELYTAPFIYINKDKMKIEKRGDKYSTFDKFEVEAIKVEKGIITGLAIINLKTRDRVFTYAKK